MTNLKKISVNSNAEVGVVRTSDTPVGDPQKKWEPGTAERYVDSVVASETARAQNAEAQLLGLVHTPHQNYVTVQTYSALPSTGSADTIYRVSNYDGANSQVDVTKYSEYAWDDLSNPNAYVLLCVKSQIDEVFDITVYNSNTMYANLSAALSGTNVPESLRRGGMSVKFIQTTPAKYTVVKTEGLTEQPTGTEIQNDPGITSGTYEASQLSVFDTLPATLNSSLTYYLTVTETVDEQEVTTYTTWVIKYVQTSDNKYVQYRYMEMDATTTATFTNVTNWQGIDEEPTPESNNLVKSSGVYNEFLQVKGQRVDYIDNFLVNAVSSIVFDISSEYYITKEIPLTAGKTYVWNNGGTVGGSATINMYARIYTSTSTRRISMNIRLESSYTFTAQEGDVKAVFTFRKGFSGQSISCDGDVIWEKKEEVYGLADAVSDITSEAYREEAVPFEWIVGKAIATDGTDATNALYMVSSFIPVEEGEQYRLTSFNVTRYTDTNVYLNIAAYSAANVESFVPDALPFYFHGRFEQSIAVIIPKGVKYVRITAVKDYNLFLNVCGCFHIIDNNIVRKINGNNRLRYVGRSKQTNYFSGNNYSVVTIANRKYFNLNASYSQQNSIAPNFAILKVSAGDKFTINKVVAPSTWYNTRFFDGDKNLIKEYSNIAYTNRVIIAPEGAAWLYIAFDDNCYIGTIEEEKQDNNIENESVRSYLDDVKYDNNDYSYSFVKNYVDNVDSVVRKDQPRGKEVTWKKNENSVKQYATIITDYGRHEVEISNSIDSYIAFNTIPNAVNICKISAELSDQSRVVLASQKVQMDGSLRMIKADSLINIRDLGGWITEDGRVTKYNSIFRGCHPSKSPYQITEADRLMMVNLLGITVDVDLSETSGTQTESPFGEGVEVLDWDSIAVHWYDFATAEAIASSKTKLVSQLTALLSKLQNGDVLYMHCFGGADRTGVACMNLEAILGMQESDMLKDYEMTSFSSYGLRERNDTTRDHPMEYVIPLVKACQGANLSEKWINWLSDSGLTTDIVNDLRQLMLRL